MAGGVYPQRRYSLDRLCDGEARDLVPDALPLLRRLREHAVLNVESVHGKIESGGMVQSSSGPVVTVYPERLEQDSALEHGLRNVPPRMRGFVQG